MKRTYLFAKEKIALFVRWIIAGIISLIVALPSIFSFSNSM